MSSPEICLAWRSLGGVSVFHADRKIGERDVAARVPAAAGMRLERSVYGSGP